MAVLLNSTIAEPVGVEMAEIKISIRLTDRLVAYGLGACIGLCMYESKMRIAGLAHIVLPAARQALRLTTSDKNPNVSPGKFADTAVERLIEEMQRYGGDVDNLRAAIVGGAHIFSGIGAIAQTSRLEIGTRNAAAVMEILERAGIPVAAADIGGSHGRTVTLRVCDGGVYVKPIGSTETMLTSLGRVEKVVR